MVFDFNHNTNSFISSKETFKILSYHFYVPCLFRNLAVMALYEFLSFVAFKKFCLFVISPKSCSAIHLPKLAS